MRVFSGPAVGLMVRDAVVGKAPATGVECASSTKCTMTAPAAAKAGAIDIRATVVGGKGKSKKSAADRYTFE